MASGGPADEHGLEVLARPTAGPAVDVALEPFDEAQPGRRRISG